MSRFPEVGEEFGHYRLDRVLGRGGMGMVFEATDTVLARKVALKVLLPTLDQSADFAERFNHEAAAMAKLDSPHAVQIFEFGQVDGCCYLTTQLISGGDLTALIRERGPLPALTAVRMAAQLADALADAHAAGIVHRDVKPHNVLVRDPDRPAVLLSDFGIATSGSAPVTRTDLVVGSFGYMAPERHLGVRAETRSDIYSLGCVLFEALTGGPPYAGSEVQVAMAHVHEPPPQLRGSDRWTPELNRVLIRSLAKDPAARYRSATEFREELETLADRMASDSPETATVQSTATGPPATTRTRSILVPLMIVAALLVSLIGGYLLLRRDSDRVADPSRTPPSSTETSPSSTETSPTTTGSPDTSPSSAPTPVTVQVANTCGRTGAGDCFLTERSAPNTHAAQLGTWDEGDTVQVICQVHGEAVESSVLGRSSDVWSRTVDGGYLASIFLSGVDRFSVVSPCPD